MSSAIVLATTAENAEALLSGKRDRDHRRIPPKRLPARAYLAVVGTGSVVGGVPSPSRPGLRFGSSLATVGTRPAPIRCAGLNGSSSSAKALKSLKR